MSKNLGKMGRPTCYKPEYCEMLKEHMGKGGSFESFGAIVHCDRSTLYKWLEAQPNFVDAKKDGEILSLKFYEDLGLKIVMGKLPDANVTAWIFMMKNMHRKHGWSDKRDMQIEGGVSVTHFTKEQVVRMAEEVIAKKDFEILIPGQNPSH